YAHPLHPPPFPTRRSSDLFNQVAAARDPAYLANLFKDTGPNPRQLNQATQGLYPTGSTFKPIVAEAALSEGLITPSTPQLCSGRSEEHTSELQSRGHLVCR